MLVRRDCRRLSGSCDESQVPEVRALTSSKKRIELISGLSLGFLVAAGLYASFVFFVLVPPTGDPLALALIKLITAFFFFSGGAVILSRKFRIPLDFLKGQTAKPAVTGVRLLFAFLAGAALLTIWGWVYNFVGYRDHDWRAFSITTKPVLSWMIALWFVHALGEELFFRGFVLGLLRKHARLPTAIALSSALFSVAHMGAAPKTILCFVAGIILALIYLRFDSLIYPIATHATLNITGQLSSIYGLSSAAQWTIFIALFLLVVAAGSYERFSRKKLGFFKA